jgi:hypothetical protein
MRIGRVISSTIEKNRDGEGNVLMLKVEISDPDDLQEVELFRQPGIDARPNADASLLIDDLGDAWQVAMAADDNIEPSVDAGEIAIYASDGTAKISQVYCKQDGTVEVGLTNFQFVALAELVKTEINRVIAAFNLHTHATAALGPPTPPTVFTPPPPPAPPFVGLVANTTTVASSNLKAEE